MSDGPERIYDNNPAEHTPRPVGFVIPKPVRHVRRRVKFKTKEDPARMAGSCDFEEEA